MAEFWPQFSMSKVTKLHFTIGQAGDSGMVRKVSKKSSIVENKKLMSGILLLREDYGYIIRARCDRLEASHSV